MFKLQFATDNVVFDAPYTADAVADALLAVSKEIRRSATPPGTRRLPIRDNNGNTIGEYTWKANKPL